MQKQVINLVAALKNIKGLARAAKDGDDVDVLRKNFEMTLTLVDKALPIIRTMAMTDAVASSSSATFVFRNGRHRGICICVCRRRRPRRRLEKGGFDER